MFSEMIIYAIQTCGANNYCSGNSACVNQQCVSCNAGYILGQDYQCHQLVVPITTVPVTAFVSMGNVVDVIRDILLGKIYCVTQFVAMVTVLLVPVSMADVFGCSIILSRNSEHSINVN